MIDKQILKSKKNKEFGEFCEDKACEYLIKKGFKILEKGFRYKRGEIDIIAKKNKLLIFVEVKGRKNSIYGEPESFVDKNKANLIIDVADEYINIINWIGNIRFDIISIKGNFYNFRINHFEDAFY